MDAANDQDLLIAIITVTILFFLFAVFTVIYFLTFRRNKKKHRQEMEESKKEFEQQLWQSQIEVQEGTYRHIAKELHDNVGQLLSTTKMLMGVTELKMGHVPDTLTTANQTLSKAIQEIRLLSRSLDREWLEQFNFLDNLQSEVDRINASKMVRAEIRCDVQIDRKADEQIILFRIVQEAIQNAIRHGEPSVVQVLISQDHELKVQVVNDGKPLPSQFSGMGTNNMQQRAKLFGGRVEWQPMPNQTIVTISLPVKKAYEN